MHLIDIQSIITAYSVTSPPQSKHFTRYAYIYIHTYTHVYFLSKIVFCFLFTPNNKRIRSGVWQKKRKKIILIKQRSSKKQSKSKAHGRNKVIHLTKGQEGNVKIRLRQQPLFNQQGKRRSWCDPHARRRPFVRRDPSAAWYRCGSATMQAVPIVMNKTVQQRQVYLQINGFYSQVAGVRQYPHTHTDSHTHTN